MSFKRHLFKEKFNIINSDLPTVNRRLLFEKMTFLCIWGSQLASSNLNKLKRNKIINIHAYSKSSDNLAAKMQAQKWIFSVDFILIICFPWADFALHSPEVIDKPPNDSGKAGEPSWNYFMKETRIKLTSPTFPVGTLTRGKAFYLISLICQMNNDTCITVQT
jgi:hypothetical protein